jgi:hypothetical protein
MAKKFLNKVPFGTMLKVLFISLLMIAGITGLVISYANPVKWIEPHLSSCMDYYLWTGCWIDSAVLYTNNIVVPLNANWISTLSVSIVLLLLAVLQPEMRKKILGFPSAMIRAYKRVSIWQNYLFQKIEFLNSESAKWRRTFNVLKSPYSLLRACGLSPQAAIGLLAVTSTAGTGVVVNETVLAERSFSNGDSGVYLAPSDIPTTFSDADNTLAINLGAIPVRSITLENVSIGEIYKGGTGNSDSSVIPSVCDATDPAKSGNAKCPAILVTGIPAIAAQGDTPAQVATRLNIGTLTVERSRCKSMQFSDIDAHTIQVEYNVADGLSVYQQPGNAPRRAAALGGHHQAEAMVTSGGTYDRVLIVAPNSGVDGSVGSLTLSNVYSKGSSCLFKNLDIGVLKIIENEVGHDSSLLTKEFEIKNTVLGANWTVTDNVELIMAEPSIEEANP